MIQPALFAAVGLGMAYPASQYMPDLAAIYAEVDHFEDAVRLLDEAIFRLRHKGRKEEIVDQEYDKHLRACRRGEPWRDLPEWSTAGK